MNTTVKVCNVCGLRLPHTDPRAIDYHKETIKANREAKRSWFKQVVADNKAVWNKNHRCYQSRDGKWFVVYRRSENNTNWQHYMQDGKTVWFFAQFQAEGFLEQKRIAAMREKEQAL